MPATSTCPTDYQIPARIIIILIGAGLARILWLMGGTPGSFRYVGSSGEPGSAPRRRAADTLVRVFWAMFPWWVFMGLIILIFVTATGRCSPHQVG